jgi:hypothetical protein
MFRTARVLKGVYFLICRRCVLQYDRYFCDYWIIFEVITDNVIFVDLVDGVTGRGRALRLLSIRKRRPVVVIVVVVLHKKVGHGCGRATLLMISFFKARKPLTKK